MINPVKTADNSLKRTSITGTLFKSTKVSSQTFILFIIFFKLWQKNKD